MFKINLAFMFSLFNYRFFLVPVAIVLSARRVDHTTVVNCRQVYIFGVRIAYWTVVQ